MTSSDGAFDSFQTIMRMLWFGMRVDEAVSTERLHHQLVPERVQFEPGFDEVSDYGPG